MKIAYIIRKRNNYKERHKELIIDFNKSYDEKKYLHKEMNIYTRINTSIFRFSPLLWEKTIGFLYFDVAKKWLWLYTKLGNLK